MDSVYKALADKTRREIIKILLEKPLTAGEIGRNFNISAPSLSRHLSILVSCGMLKAQRIGQHKLFVLNKRTLQEFMLSAYEEFGL